LERLQRLQYQDSIAAAKTKSEGQIHSSHNATLALLEITQGIERCWFGDLDGAAECADRVCSDPKRGADQAMVRLFEVWLRAEIAWALEDWSIAEAHAQRLQLLSLRFENEHLRAVAYLLQAQIYAAQGKDGLAQTHLRLMKAHEAQLRNENLNDCDELFARGAPVVTAVKTNGVGQHSAFINPFEMLDSLTGMKNRRYLEQIAPGLIARSAEHNKALVMIFIDVNRFQGINERHTHSVGDAVLKTLARILENTVPDSDLLARLGGDEFVIVIAPPSTFELRAILQQVRDQVSGYEWGQISPGLNVSVSCVSAVAEPLDTFDSWLHRCELSMCLEKHTQELNFI
jgi:diguanylate cyclase (GGDEF)-like protein